MSDKHSHRPFQPQHGADAGHGAERPHNRDRARDAYAAQDPAAGSHATGTELPPFHPGGAGGLGGLFTEPHDAGCPDKHSSDLPEGELTHEELMERCRAELCAACQAKKEADETKLRALAEVDNARKRMAREKDEHIRYASEAVLGDIIPALDNLELALQHAVKDEACKNFVMGVEMTRKLLLDSLAKHGLEAVGQVGQLFDPNLHEAVGMTSAPDVADGHVCALLSCGYRLRERLIRPARVMVCKKG